LLYVNRSRVDVLSGTLKGFFRQAIEGQIRSEGPDVLDTLRRQLESGRDGALQPSAPYVR
jgi:hypothetical protein